MRILNGQIKFKDNTISCRNVSFAKIMWEYICWTLAGKPDNHSVDTTRWYIGDVAQLGEHYTCTVGVAGSNPVISTIIP